MALVERERQFRSVFFDGVDAMLILDDHRQIAEANPAACRMLGIDAGTGLHGSLDGLLLGGDEERLQLAAAWREMLALGEARREHRVRARGQAPPIDPGTFGRPSMPARGCSSAATGRGSTASDTCSRHETSPIAGCSKSG